MRIVVDQDILSVDESFGSVGELIKLPGRKISRADLMRADALLVRSTTSVNEALLSGTAVKFVGSATSGVDHVDLEYLQRQGIGFSHTKGCNANAVVEYCFTALSIISSKRSFEFSNKTFSIIGAGNVGARFAIKLARLGFQCVVCDPYLNIESLAELKKNNCTMVKIDQALSADVISLHVPLTTSGDHPSYHLLSKSRLAKLKHNAVVINTSRGSVIDNKALLEVMETRHDLITVLDVWENEPAINVELVAKVDVASPHIAGYSVEAKFNATLKLVDEFCNYFSIAADKTGLSRFPKKGEIKIEITSGEMLIGDEFCSAVLLQAFSLDKLSTQYKQDISHNADNVPIIFDKLRLQLASRREFSAYQPEKSKLSERQALILSTIGFS